MLQRMEFANGRVEVTGYQKDDDVLLNITVNGLCVHQIRLQGVADEELQSVRGSILVRPHVVPFGQAFEDYLAQFAHRM